MDINFGSLKSKKPLSEYLIFEPKPRFKLVFNPVFKSEFKLGVYCNFFKLESE